MDVAIEELVTQSGVSRAPGCEPWSEVATWSRTWAMEPTSWAGARISVQQGAPR